MNGRSQESTRNPVKEELKTEHSANNKNNLEISSLTILSNLVLPKHPKYYM